MIKLHICTNSVVYLENAYIKVGKSDTIELINKRLKRLYRGKLY